MFSVAFPFVAADGDPGHDGNFGGLKEFFGDVFVHGDGGAEDACADEGQSGEVQQALDRAVFAKGAVHDGEDDVDALAGAAAVEADEGGVGRIGGHRDALAGAKNFRKHFLRAGADEPVAFFGDADGHGLVFVGVEAANHGGGRGEGNFVFAGAAAEENADAQTLFVRGHGDSRFWSVRMPVSSYRAKGRSCRGGSRGVVRERQRRLAVIFRRRI